MLASEIEFRRRWYRAHAARFAADASAVADADADADGIRSVQDGVECMGGQARSSGP
ncbi:MAG: hypothetical protein AB7I38_16090 [Dehalococcoidia bacterium]